MKTYFHCKTLQTVQRPSDCPEQLNVSVSYNGDVDSKADTEVYIFNSSMPDEDEVDSLPDIAITHIQVSE